MKACGASGVWPRDATKRFLGRQGNVSGLLLGGAETYWIERGLGLGWI